jgi:hypothetical protein
VAWASKYFTLSAAWSAISSGATAAGHRPPGGVTVAIYAHHDMRRFGAAIVVGLLTTIGVIATAVVSWWAVGDQSIDSPDDLESTLPGQTFDDVTLDYMIRLEEPSTATMRSLAIGSFLILAVLLVASLVTVRRRGPGTPPWRPERSWAPGLSWAPP